MQTTVDLKLIAYHPAQHQVDSEARRFNVLACGRRWGKTEFALDKVIEPALYGYPVGWFNPTYKMLAEVWRQAKSRLSPITARSDSTDYRLELVTGGVLDMWSLEKPDAARGRKYKRVAIDEAAMIKNLGEAWQGVIRPTLTDYEGDAWFPSSPRGHNFFWQMFQWGQDPEKPEWASWQMPTNTNPYIKGSEIEAARQELPDRIFRQEYLAEFLEDAGGVFRNVRAAATATKQEPYKGDFVMGVDWAQMNDFTVLTVLDATTKRMVDSDRFNKVDWALQRSRLAALANKWAVRQIVAERNSIGSPNIEALQREGLPVVAFDTTASSKPPLIESLVLAFEKGELAILADPVLIGELEAYERTVSEVTGRSRYSAPEGMHDDCVMSLALAYWGVTSRRFFGGVL